MPVNGGRFKQIFSKEQLEQLKNYIVDIERRAFGLTKVQFQKIVFDFAEKSGIPHSFNNNTKIAGEGWLSKFMSNNNLSLRTPEATSVGRLMCFNKTNVDKFFFTLKEIRSLHNYQAHQIYNVDESGFSTVPTKQPKVISPTGVKRVAKVVTAERGKNVTVVCGINAIGTYVSPFFIFPRKRMRPEFLVGAPPGSNAIAHESGWMTTDNFLHYLNHFVKYAKPREDNKILLILDNHASHCSLEAIQFCRNHFITMLGFPPHTTHRLQPLDVSVFGPIKTFYSQACEKFMTSHPGLVISEAHIASLFGEAYFKGATMHNAISGFKSCGIEPFHPNIFQDNDFAASATTDRQLEVECDINIDQSLILDIQPVSPPLIDCATICQPGPSTTYSLEVNDMITTPISQNIENILPDMPTAIRKLRKSKSKLPSMVLTCTPVKDYLEDKLKTKNDLIAKKEERKRNKIEKNKNKINKNKCIKKRKEKSVKKKLFMNVSSYSENEESQYVSTNNEDSADEECLYCNEPFKNDVMGETWICCIKCNRWAHEICTGLENLKQFNCELCS